MSNKGITKMYDAAVIGGGPAGLSFGLHSKEIKVIILEEHSKIGVPVHCGECISELCINKFKLNLPKTSIARKVNGIKMIFPNQKQIVLYEKGYVLNKDIFEQYLAMLAEKKGVEIRKNYKVKNVEKRNDYWRINNEINAKVIVDATGHAQVMSGLLGINKNSEKKIGVQYRMDDIPFNDTLEFYILPEYAPRGYLWNIPKTPGTHGPANVGLITDNIKMAKPNLDRFLKTKAWNKKKFMFGGMLPSSGPLDKTYGTGFLMIGDAAGFTSPVFEGGTHLSLMSGKFAAQVVHEAVNKNDFSQQILKQYKNLWMKDFPAYNKILKGRNALYKKLTEKDLEHLGEVLPENFNNFGIKEKLMLGLRMILKDASIYNRGVLDALFALGYSTAQYYGW